MIDRKELIKKYAPIVVLNPGMIMLSSHMINNRRQAALMAAYTLTSKNLEQYRRRVKRRTLWWRFKSYIKHLLKIKKV